MCSSDLPAHFGKCCAKTRLEKMKTRTMNRDWIATAATLNQALPYLQRYTGATVVIKLGGHAMGSDEGMERFRREVVLVRRGWGGEGRGGGKWGAGGVVLLGASVSRDDGSSGSALWFF